MNSKTKPSTVIEEFCQNLIGGIKDPKEEYGDFYYSSDSSFIGFEVYCPNEPLSRSTKTLKKDTKETSQYKGSWVSQMGGGLSPDRLNELIERALSVKSHQFSDARVCFKKVLLIDLRLAEFASLDNFSPVGNFIVNNSFNPNCSAILINGGYAKTRILNESAKYKLTEGDISHLDKKFLNFQIIRNETP